MAEKKKKASAGKTVITPKFRVSYPAVFKPRAFENEDGSKTKERYQVVMLFPKDTDLSEIRKAIFAAKKSKWGPDKKKWPKNMRATIRDGAEKEDTDGYGEGVYFMTASGDRKPGLISASKRPIESEDDFYAGCWARAEVAFYPYDRMGNKGVGVGLRNLQKIADDDPFSGQRPADEVFDKVDDGEEDEDEDNEDTEGEEDEDEEDDPKPAKKKKKAKPVEEDEDDEEEEGDEDSDDSDDEDDEDEEEDAPPPKKKKKKRTGF